MTNHPPRTIRQITLVRRGCLRPQDREQSVFTREESTPAGCIVESFTDPERDPLQAELFENPPAIADGWLTLNDAPGLGLTLADAALAKFGQKIFSCHGSSSR
jgi:hypothetical protein